MQSEPLTPSKGKKEETQGAPGKAVGGGARPGRAGDNTGSPPRHSCRPGLIPDSACAACLAHSQRALGMDVGSRFWCISPAGSAACPRAWACMCLGTPVSGHAGLTRPEQWDSKTSTGRRCAADGSTHLSAHRAMGNHSINFGIKSRKLKIAKIPVYSIGNL